MTPWLRIGGIVALSAAVLGVVAYVTVPYFMRTGDHEAPLNTVVVTERLATSGQPSEAQLRRLKEWGYEAVINLAPPTSYGSVSDEAEIVRETMAYLNIPVNWEQPGAEDFERFRRQLAEWRDRRIWVHCQMNMRASVFTLLYRVIDERVPLPEAIDAVQRIWIPNPVWSAFMRETLTRHGIAFDPDDLR